MSVTREYRDNLEKEFTTLFGEPFFSAVYAHKARLMKKEDALLEIAQMTSFLKEYLITFHQGKIWYCGFHYMEKELVDKIRQREEDPHGLYEYIHYAYVTPCLNLIREDTTLSRNKAYVLLQKMAEDMANWVGLYDDYFLAEEVTYVDTTEEVAKCLCSYFRTRQFRSVEIDFDGDVWYVSFLHNCGRIKNCHVMLRIDPATEDDDCNFVLYMIGIAFFKEEMIMPMYQKLHIDDTVELTAIERIITTSIEEFESSL